MSETFIEIKIGKLMEEPEHAVLFKVSDEKTALFYYGTMIKSIMDYIEEEDLYDLD